MANLNKFPRQEDFPKLDGAVLTNRSMRQVLKNSYSDPGIKEMFKGFSLDVDPRDYED